MSLLLFFATSDVVAYRHNRIPLTLNHVYKLSMRVRATINTTFNLLVTDSSIQNVSLNTSPSLYANTWKTVAAEFTAVKTDTNSSIWVKPQTVPHDFYVDKVFLTDLTLNRKEYRIMRIQGSMLPGSFVQTLTLREKTTAETA